MFKVKNVLEKKFFVCDLITDVKVKLLSVCENLFFEQVKREGKGQMTKDKGQK